MNTVLLSVIIASVGCCFLCLYRGWRGETIADRMVAIDILGILVVSTSALLAVYFDCGYLIDIGLAWVFLAFVGTLALAKCLSGKQLDE